jgi:Predicted membrane protein (DUF2306)
MTRVTTTKPSGSTVEPVPHPIARGIGWAVMALFSLGVAGYAIFLVLTGFAFVPAEIAANRFPTALGLRTHISASALALLTGPFQFLRPLRRRFPVAHHWIGRVYIAACLVGGVAGGAIALFSTSGLVAGFGFFALAVSWLTCTVAALLAVRRRDFLAHQRWMIRSFALTLAAVTLRIYIPLGMGIAHLGFPEIYPFVAWLCWMPNLLIAQLFVRRARGANDF